MQRLSRIRLTVFGLGVLSALAFGVSAATARPAPVKENRIVCPNQFRYTGCQKCCNDGGSIEFIFDPNTGSCICL